MPTAGQANFGVIVAAGRGRRFGGLKQFARVKNKPLLFYSLRAFERCPVMKGYVVVANPGKICAVRRMGRIFRLKKLRAVVKGGRERMDSVAAGLAALPEEGYVAVHDAARPLIVPAMLARGFRIVRQSGAVAFGARVTETVKEVVGRRIVRTVDREGLVTIQTPQFFDLRLLRRAYARCRNQGVLVTDECQAVELWGVEPVVIVHERLNLKVTYPEDLLVCEALL
ncbi:MAG: 2-C-methyl-D-erythritol 4-phosphate cytidylyltransferase [candidate division WOR-3 bacterium]